MLGKQKCKILKEIRQRIADENDIPFVTEECRHQGHCSGTCPRCESELRYLENQLQKRASLGKRVTVAAICTGIALSAAGCDSFAEDIRSKFEPTETPEIFVLDGEVPNDYDYNYGEDTGETVSPVPTATEEYLEFQTTGIVPVDYEGNPF